MQTLIVSIVTTVVGIVVAILVSRHYYSRSSKHRLAIYSMPSPSIFYGVDPEIRNGLSIQFRGEVVKELSVVEFLVANEGVDAIRNSIQPLMFTIGDQCRIVDASVTYVHPEGRVITIEVESDHQFRCDFALLNPGEYFYVKLITDGRARESDIICTIVADDLPPRIVLESASRVSIGDDDRAIDWGALIFAVVFFIIGTSIILPIVSLYESHPTYFPFAWSKFDFVWWLAPALIIAALLATVLIVFSLVMVVIAIVGNLPPRQRFRRPGRPYGAHFYGIGYPPAFADSEDAVMRHPRE